MRVYVSYERAIEALRIRTLARDNRSFYAGMPDTDKSRRELEAIAAAQLEIERRRRLMTDLPRWIRPR